MTRASRTKRLTSLRLTVVADNTLTATVRREGRCSATKTSPIPPRPMLDSNLYLPSTTWVAEPGDRGFSSGISLSLEPDGGVQRVPGVRFATSDRLRTAPFVYPTKCS